MKVIRILLMVLVLVLSTIPLVNTVASPFEKKNCVFDSARKHCLWSFTTSSNTAVSDPESVCLFALAQKGINATYTGNQWSISDIDFVIVPAPDLLTATGYANAYAAYLSTLYPSYTGLSVVAIPVGACTVI